MSLNPNYIVSTELESYFVDKSTGEPLANGVVNFYEDNNRTVGKVVYELTGSPPNYTYTALPNPLILSNTGTFQDASGNNIAVYYYPYDADGNIQLYYITVTDALGVEQFTREAWPNEFATATSSKSGAIVNQMSNPQFAVISFISPLTIAVPGSTTVNVAIAPGWILNATATAAGSGTVTVTQNAIAGTAAYPYNPPFTLTVTPGANISALSLSQTLNNDPNIWSPQTGTANNGYVATSILLAPASSLSINYVPSSASSQILLTANNAGGVYQEFTQTVQLTAPANADTGETGYVNIVLVLPTNTPTTFSNMQVVPLQSNVSGIVYAESTVNQQINQLFYSYLSSFNYKPTSSYLVGWDFPFNPTQFLGPTVVAIASGNNTSNYYWDQTIIFQSSTSGVGVTRSAAGNRALRITAAAATQFALIQYIPAPLANSLLQNFLSVNVAAITGVAGGLSGTVSLWYTTGALPSTIGGKNSLVATLTAAGKPATFNGAWVEIPRNGAGSSASTTSLLGDAVFTVGAGTGNNFNDYGFNGWGLQGNAAVNTATFVAIVVGFAQLTLANTIDFLSISLVPGNIPTRPAPKTQGTNTSECWAYYWKSFAPSVIPAQNVGYNTGELSIVAGLSGANRELSNSFTFPTQMYSVPTMVTYNPVAANAQVRDFTASADCSNSVASTSMGQNAFSVVAQGNPATTEGNQLYVHITADARLGQ